MDPRERQQALSAQAKRASAWMKALLGKSLLPKKMTKDEATRLFKAMVQLYIQIRPFALGPLASATGAAGKPKNSLDWACIFA